jgi:hypothetical protein
MTKLDKFADSLIKKTNKKATIINNPDWLKKVKNPLSAKKKFLNRTKYLELSRKLIKKAKKNKINSKIRTKIGSKLFYIRYADDFLIGYQGTKNNAKEYIKNIKNFIKSNLQLNCTGFKLISAHSDYVNYLGFKLSCPKKEETLTKNRPIREFKKLKNKLTMRKVNENSKYLKTLE